MKKVLFYAACSAAISLTFFLGLYSIASQDGSFWVILAGMNLAIWSSFPKYRSSFLRVATLTLTLAVLANPAVSLLAGVLAPRGEELPRLRPNTVVRTNMVEGALPGMSGIRRFSVDGHGFRTNGPIDYAAKPPGALRIVAIGASTMEEGFIDDRETWTFRVAGQLEKSSGRKVELVNMAFAGMRADHFHRMLLESEAFRPDVAIFLMGINDWNRAIHERFDAAQSKQRKLLSLLGGLSAHHTLLYRGIELVNLAVVAQLDRWGIDMPAVDSRGGEATAGNNSLERPIKVEFHPATVDAHYAARVGEIMSECRRRSIECIFLDQPTAYQPDITPELRRRLWMTPVNAAYTVSLEDAIHVARLYNGWLGAMAKERGFRFCSLSSHVPPSTEYFFDDCHYNDNGSRTVARLVSACLADLR